MATTPNSPESNNYFNLVLAGLLGGIGSWVWSRIKKVLLGPENARSNKQFTDREDALTRRESVLRQKELDMEKLIRDVLKQITDFRREMNNGFSESNERLSRIEGTMHGMIKRVATLESQQ